MKNNKNNNDKPGPKYKKLKFSKTIRILLKIFITDFGFPTFIPFGIRRNKQ